MSNQRNSSDISSNSSLTDHNINEMPIAIPVPRRPIQLGNRVRFANAAPIINDENSPTMEATNDPYMLLYFELQEAQRLYGGSPRGHLIIAEIRHRMTDYIRTERRERNRRRRRERERIDALRQRLRDDEWMVDRLRRFGDYPTPFNLRVQQENIPPEMLNNLGRDTARRIQIDPRDQFALPTPVSMNSVEVNNTRTGLRSATPINLARPFFGNGSRFPGEEHRTLDELHNPRVRSLNFLDSV